MHLTSPTKKLPGSSSSSCPPGFAWPHRLIAAGVAGELLICALLIFGACPECDSPLRATLSLFGAIFYAATLVLTLTVRGSALFWAVSIAFAVHAGLGMLMIYYGIGCWLCIAAALLALVNFILACSIDPTCLKRFAITFPPAFLALGFLSLSAAARAEGWEIGIRPASLPSPAQLDSGAVSITVFEVPNCPYCRRLKEEILPLLDDASVRVRFMDAGLFDLIDRVPFIVVKSGSGRRRVIEGLPTIEILRSTIDHVRGKVQ